MTKTNKKKGKRDPKKDPKCISFNEIKEKIFRNNLEDVRETFPHLKQLSRDKMGVEYLIRCLTLNAEMRNTFAQKLNIEISKDIDTLSRISHHGSLLLQCMFKTCSYNQIQNCYNKILPCIDYGFLIGDSSNKVALSLLSGHSEEHKAKIMSCMVGHIFYISLHCYGMVDFLVEKTPMVVLDELISKRNIENSCIQRMLEDVKANLIVQNLFLKASGWRKIILAKIIYDHIPKLEIIKYNIGQKFKRLIGSCGNDDAIEKFNDLCNDLNLDSPTKHYTWRTFEDVREKYMLEGQVSHWLCCAIYVACRKANIPSINSHISTSTMHGSYVNLTRLLRTSGLSLVQFFDKSRKWADMTSSPQEYRSKIERLERNFAVTTVIFKKFKPIFAGIFKDYRDIEENRANRKKLSPKSPNDLFEFCWTLFLSVKSSLRISDDLVNSYHLLLSCVDLVFNNVVQEGRKNLLTTQFQEIADSMEIHGETGYCIIHTLCDLYDGISVEAKTINECWLRPKIKAMIENSSLRGDPDNLTGLIEESYFEYNSRQLEKEYEEYVLTEGDFDERIYLSADRQADFGVNQSHHDDLATPISTATQTVSNIQSLLTGLTACPSEDLKNIFSTYVRNPPGSIELRIKQLSEIFIANYAVSTPDQLVPGFHLELAHYRSKIAQTLYYRLLENILHGKNGDSKIRNDKNELTDLLEGDNFHKSLFALCIEIILYSYHSQRRFPWILEIFELPGYHFYKVIEVAVRAEDGLCRDVVNNLSQIEERILEDIAWNRESPLWEALEKNSAEPIPSCDEVFLPSQMERLPESQQGDGMSENAPKRYAGIKTAGGVEKCVPVQIGENTSSTLIIQDKASSQILGVVLPSKHGEKAKKNNSTAIFFRKFYHLAFIRLQKLCKNLKVDDDNLRKIWTCFQQAIVNHEELMKSRHLDQIVMCCVYVVSKVVGQDKTFTDIMKYYRLQPQCASHVYRSVLLENDERGDLINFYNSIFISRMQRYALKFSNRGYGDDLAVKLPPIPQLKSTPLSPVRKLADKHSVFVKPLRTNKTPSPSKQLRYNFNTARSPVANNNLKAINDMIQGASSIDNRPKAVKRLLEADENMDMSPESSEIPSKIFVKNPGFYRR